MTRTSRALFVLLAFVAAGAVPARGGDEPPLPEKDVSGVPGNMALVDLRAFEIRTPGADPRLLVQVLVENRTPRHYVGRWRAVVRRGRKRATIGECEGAALPRGQVAACDVWIPWSAVKEGETLEAALDREVPEFARWDSDPSDDTRTVTVRTVPEDGTMLRIARFEVSPRILQGMGEVRVRFSVEGAHLVWLIGAGKTPRLLGGHPADGLLEGKTTVRVRRSGPLTLVARNSLGAFVYQTVPVLNTYSPPRKPGWVKKSAQELDGTARARILDAGVYDVDSDHVILENLREYLAAKDWAREYEMLRRQHDRGRPVPASVLNPAALEHRR